ncbi:hypothetical protein [Cellulomonas sp. ATA003]|uniref:hypothetical protein n=1 Tax=Cellulomonas sp. ATA003 TaxID=3073064 RepID=UPI002873E720|nr:hypothetical protein [Cellulomonas sp. ATA003]WNB86760.1 hypothetical protein REH70_05975 [Cellulomonas sp. ATA003]
MKRLVTATAAALLLGGCTSGGTGHLDPEISPDLIGPRSTQEPETTTAPEDEDGAGVQTPAPGAGAGAANDVEAAFAESSGSETWYGEVQSVDVDEFTVVVSTSLDAGDADAVEVCEAAFAAAGDTGIASPIVEVRDSGGQSISERSEPAGDEGCSSDEPEPTASANPGDS